jgi:PAS domain S-box-containing protein
MALYSQVADAEGLRERVAELEAELQRQRENQKTGEQRFRWLADTAPVMLWTTGTDALCSYVNRAWLDFRGRAMEQELGNGWTEGIHPEDRSLCLETYLKAFSMREPFRLQYRMLNAGGEYRWVEAAGAPRFENDGVFAGYAGSAGELSRPPQPVFTPDEQAVRLVFTLTARERQVLALIAQGKSTKETAARLGISYKTADSHRSRVLEKLGVHETASMVRYAIRAGLIQP